ncbi:MAG: hypothetical protein FJ405_10145, partial [Verrucomicrobia bacterium]|nr:hypothetical protein [Verrucomicrobiota bacterium]
MKPFLLFSKLKVVLGFVLTSAAATAWGEALPNSPQPVGLEAITREALDRNPEGRWFLAELEVARSLRKQAGLRPPPEVSGEAGRKSVRGNGLHEEGVAWAASVTQAFEWPGR